MRTGSLVAIFGPITSRLACMNRTDRLFAWLRSCGPSRYTYTVRVAARGIDGNGYFVA